MAHWHNLDNIIQNLADEGSRKYFVKVLVTHFGNTGTPKADAITTPEYKELHRNIPNATYQGQFQQFMTDYNNATVATADNALNPLRILVDKINTDSNLDFLNNGNIAGYFVAPAPNPMPVDPVTPYPPATVTTAFGPIKIPDKWQVHRSLKIITYNLDGSRNKSELDNIITTGFLGVGTPKTLILLQGAENYTLAKPANTHLHEIGGTNGFKKLYICAKDNTSGPPGGYNLTDSKHNLYGFTRNEGDKLLWLATYSDEGNYIIVNVQFPADAPSNFPANFDKHVVARLKGDPNFNDRINAGYAIFIAGDFGCSTPANALTTVGATNQLAITGFDTPAGKHTFKPTPLGTGFTDVRDHILFNDKVDQAGLPANINVINTAIGAFVNIETISTHLPVNIQGELDFYIAQGTVTNYIPGHTKGVPTGNPDLTSALTDDNKIGSMLDTMGSQITKMTEPQLRTIVNSNIYNFTRGSMPVVVATPKTPAPAPVTPPLAPVTPPPAPPPAPTTFHPPNFATVTSTGPSANYNYIPAPTDKFKFPKLAHNIPKPKPGTNITTNLTFSDGVKGNIYITWLNYSQKSTTDPYIFYGTGYIGPKSANTDIYHFRYNMAGTGKLEIYNHTTKTYDALAIT